jgi:hypothetical protein
MKLRHTIVIMGILGILISSCALPRPYIHRSSTYEEFLKVINAPPQYQWAYCGSDAKHHYFAQWRYGAMLLHTGRSSYLIPHKVPREEMNVRNEFPRTTDMSRWRQYSFLQGDRDGRFAKDFLRKGDRVKPAGGSVLTR